LWRAKTNGYFDMSSSVIASDGTIYLGSRTDNSIYSISSAGSIQGVFPVRISIYSTLSIGPNGNIYITGSNKVMSLTPSGSIVWQRAFPLFSMSNSTSTAIGADGTLYVSADYMYAFTPSGSLVWISRVPSPLTPSIAKNGVIYVGSGYDLYAIGTPLSTLSPSVMPSKGLQIGASPKFKCNAQNNVCNFCYYFYSANFVLLCRVYRNTMDL
jgi:outer membrane protein assembly factor BamB